MNSALAAHSAEPKLRLKRPCSPTTDLSARNQLLRTALMHAPELLCFLTRQVSNVHDAQDLMQELYLALLKAQPAEGIRHHKAYLFTIAANLAHQHRQRNRTRPEHLPLTDAADFQIADPTFESNEPESAAALAERVARFGEHLRELSPKVRAAVIWHHRDGYTCEEIAVKLSVVTHRVKKYLVKGLTHCRAACI